MYLFAGKKKKPSVIVTVVLVAVTHQVALWWGVFKIL